MSSKSSWVWTIIAGAAFVLLLAAGWKLRAVLQAEGATVVAVDPACDLRQGSCTTPLADDAKVIFGIEPRAIPLLAPLTLNVRVENMPVDKVEVDFSGVDMFMGFNRPLLEPLGQGRFTGSTEIPVCTQKSMLWEAKVLLYTPDGVQIAPYRFETHR